ncbi:hypothetical protein GmHk_19G054443 [Glycine max]|nr:hypothetical protein GmHk_19G054443 [Glycine max]
MIWSRARKRSETLALLTEAELVETHVSAPAPGGWPLAGEPSAVDTASCLMTQRDQPDEVVAMRLRPAVHHPAPA